jgi:hypothetical protein
MSGTEVPALTIEARAIKRTERFIAALQELGISPPYYVFVTIVGVRGRALNTGSAYNWSDDSTPPNQGILHLPVAIVESVGDTQSVAKAFKPALDAFWNAWGFAGSPCYKADHWTQREQE